MFAEKVHYSLYNILHLTMGVMFEDGHKTSPAKAGTHTSTVGGKRRRSDSENSENSSDDLLSNLSGATVVSARRVRQRLDRAYSANNNGNASCKVSENTLPAPKSYQDANDSGDNNEKDNEGEVPFDGRNEEEEESDNEWEEDERDNGSAAPLLCPCCELATSDVMRDLDKIADSLAGRASHEHVTTMQLKVFEARVAPLRYEGRDNVPNITRKTLLDHYTKCRISPLRSVAQDIRLFEEAEHMLQSSLTDVDDEGTSMLSSRGASELCRLSKGKLDALKFYAQLDKDRKQDETNSKKS